MRKFESSTLLYSNDVMYASDDATTYYDCGIKYNHLCLVIIRLRLECYLLVFVGETPKKCKATHWDGQCGNGVSPNWSRHGILVSIILGSSPSTLVC
jgi:hypothetical protein